MTIIYLIFLLIIFLYVLLCYKAQNKTNLKIFITISFGVLFVVHTFVNQDFSDLLYYKLGFYEISKMSWFDVLQRNAPSLKAEVGYRLYNKLISFFTDNFTVLLAISSFIILYGYYKIIKQYSPMVLLSILLLLVGPYMQSLFVLRQHMAIGIVLLSISYIIQRDIKHFLLCIIVAIGFHQTAAVFLPVYFIYGLKSNKTISILMLLAFVSLPILMSVTLRFLGGLAAETASYGNYYFETSSEGTNAKEFLLMSGLLILRYYIVRKHFFDDGINKLFSIISLLSVVFLFSGIGFIATNRLFLYYTCMQFVILPNTLSYLSKKGLRIIGGFSYLCFLLYFFTQDSNTIFFKDLTFF